MKYMKRVVKVSAAGHQDLQIEYEALQKKRVEAVQELAHARSMGDLSENSAYKVARQKLSGIDRRIRYLTNILRHAEVVKPASAECVDIGATVVVSDGSAERTFLIVGGHESDLSKGRLSCYSPIGRALMGRREGDTVRVQVPAGTVSYIVLQIRVE